MAAPEFHLFLPQMRMTLPKLADRARCAEEAGFSGLAMMDHLAPPMAERHDMYEAMTTAMYLATQTTELAIGHLVLCDAFRHPAVLARQAVTIDHASDGRFEIGIGWGSVPEEFETFGVGETRAATRVARLAETLEVIEALHTGEPVDYDGDFHHLAGAQQMPTPIDRIPIVIGGAGPKTLALVAQHADWWNCPIYAVDRFDELKEQTGSARASLQERVTFIHSEEDRAETTETADRRFGPTGRVTGNGEELVEHFTARVGQGVERFYIWFTDFASPATLRRFGEEVIGAVASDR